MCRRYWRLRRLGAEQRALHTERVVRVARVHLVERDRLALVRVLLAVAAAPNDYDGADHQKSHQCQQPDPRHSATIVASTHARVTRSGPARVTCNVALVTCAA